MKNTNSEIYKLSTMYLINVKTASFCHVDKITQLFHIIPFLNLNIRMKLESTPNFTINQHLQFNLIY